MEEIALPNRGVELVGAVERHIDRARELMIYQGMLQKRSESAAPKAVNRVKLVLRDLENEMTAIDTEIRHTESVLWGAPEEDGNG